MDEGPRRGLNHSMVLKGVNDFLVLEGGEGLHGPCRG